MLPDLWRIADRRVRALHVDHGDAEGALSEVLAGIDHHLDVDRWFHADAVFLEGERFTATLLREAAIDAPRIGLFAHILWELCLDGALVRSHGDTIPNALGAAFDAATRDSAFARAATLHHFGRVSRTEAERDAFDHRMHRIETELARGTWIAGYAHGAGIAERIDGVRARVGFAPLVDTNRTKLADVADALLDRARSVVDVILAWRKDGATGSPTPPPLHEAP